uniref:Uncharacterized protein n=1 Tax=Neolamprologus brichardi TaxID=32507 RepID=A0A3Q4GF14_NEOBR
VELLNVIFFHTGICITIRHSYWYLQHPVFQFSDITAVVNLVCGCCPGGTRSNTLTLGLQVDMNLRCIHEVMQLIECVMSYLPSLTSTSPGRWPPLPEPGSAEGFFLLKGSFSFPFFLRVIFILTCIENGDIAMAVLSPSLLAIGAPMPFMGFSFGYLFSGIFRLSHAERRTVSMETGCENILRGSTILKIAFPQEVIDSLHGVSAVGGDGAHHDNRFQSLHVDKGLLRLLTV